MTWFVLTSRDFVLLVRSPVGVLVCWSDGEWWRAGGGGGWVGGAGGGGGAWAGGRAVLTPIGPPPPHFWKETRTHSPRTGLQFRFLQQLPVLGCVHGSLCGQHVRSFRLSFQKLPSLPSVQGTHRSRASQTAQPDGRTPCEMSVLSLLTRVHRLSRDARHVCLGTRSSLQAP